MATIYKIGLSFEFDPYGEHDFLFEGMNENEIEKYCRTLALEDIGNLVANGEIARQLTIEKTEGN
jgi:hypothetical protein